MENLIIYYSLSGNNQRLAHHLSAQLHCEALPIVETHKRGPLTTVLDLLFRRSPKIKPIGRSLQNYDRLIFLAPIWAGRIASPLRTFLTEHKTDIRRYTFISISGGYEKPDQKQRFERELTEILGSKPEAVFELQVSDLLPPQDRQRIKTVSEHRVTQQDLKLFKSQIEEIVTMASAESADSVEPTRPRQNENRSTADRRDEAQGYH